MVCAGAIKLGIVAWGRSGGHRGTPLQGVCMEVMIVGRFTLKLYSTVCRNTHACTALLAKSYASCLVRLKQQFFAMAAMLAILATVLGCICVEPVLRIELTHSDWFQAQHFCVA